MVMKLNTGVPGAGKTYLMVKSFIDLFCTWDKEIERFVLKDEHKDKVLISNIEGLTLQHYDIETLMNERCQQLAKATFIKNIGGNDIDMDSMQDVIDEFYYKFLDEKVRWFFSYDYQKQLLDKFGPVIYLIEESQRYFDSKELGRANWVRDVLFFFEKHRHFGFSIFCDTQHSTKLHKGIVALFETETRAKPRTLSVLGEFKYNEYADDVKTNQIPIVVKPDERIYKTYKSMSHKEVVKTKKPGLRLVIFVLGMMILSLVMFGYVKNNLGGGVVHAKDSSSISDSKEKDKVLPKEKKNVLPEEKEKEWRLLSHWMDRRGHVTVIHPLTNEFVPLKQFVSEMKVKVSGNSLYCLCPVETRGEDEPKRTERLPLSIGKEKRSE